MIDTTFLEMTEIERTEWVSGKLRKLNFLQSEMEQVEQILGKALGYPWYRDDQKNFPGATTEDGVCVGEHTTVTLAMEAADRLEFLEDENEIAYKARRFETY